MHFRYVRYYSISIKSNIYEKFKIYIHRRGYVTYYLNLQINYKLQFSLSQKDLERYL